MNIWEGENLASLFLGNPVSEHKPRPLTGRTYARKEGTVMTVQEDEKLPSVFRKLTTEGFLSAPVCRGSELRGQVSLLDLVKYVNGLFFGTSEADWVEFWDKQFEFQTQKVSNVLMEPDEYDRAPHATLNQDYTSFAALELMARSGYHSVLLMDGAQRLNGIVTQSMLISFLRQSKAKWGHEFTTLKVKDFKSADFNKPALKTISEEDTAINAFLRMEVHDIHGLPVVDSEGVLTGCISVRDLRGVGDDGSKFFRLYRNVKQFKELCAEDYTSLAPTSHYSTKRVPSNAVYVTEEDTMENVLAKMDDGNLHRVIICDTDSVRRGRPIPKGVLSQRDVLFQVLDTIINQAKLGYTPLDATSMRATSKSGIKSKVAEEAKQYSSPRGTTASPKRNIPINFD